MHEGREGQLCVSEDPSRKSYDVRELEGEHCFPLETQQPDRSGQLLEICGLGNVGLESGPQGIEPVFGGRAAREFYPRSVAATLRLEAPHLPDQPVAVFFWHGKA